MTAMLLVAADVLAIALLALGVYHPRHGRRDLVVSFVAVNVGVLAVAVALSTTAVGAGVGLGLFGVLSIIRLRSSELEQHEVAYYFSALALGLLGGITTTPAWLAPALMATIVMVMFVGDHPRLLHGRTTHSVVLDRAYTDPDAMRDRLERELGRRVRSVHVKKLDLVADTTTVVVSVDAPERTDVGVDQPLEAR